MNYENQAAPIPERNVSITGRFWKEFMEKARTQVIPYQWEALNDRIPGAEPSHAMRNFRVASGKEKGEFGGHVFQESDAAKWIEAAAYSLMWHPDPELERTIDGAIDDIVAAQQPDGYLNTYYIVTGLEKRFTNLKDNHELYCLGHFLEGAIAYYKATGKDKLMNALIRYVDLVDRLMGPEEGKIQGYPGHEEIELALIKLYDVTGDEKHLRLAKYFIDQRGKEPLFFREENEKHGNGFYWKNSVFQFNYYQAGEPVRDQQFAEGHSVRAVYLYSGMADVARKTGDDTLLEACRRLWTDVTKRQMYITGAIGSSAYGEAFTFDYDLPNDTVYGETCASIGLIFFARRMLNLEPKGEYADVLERALYNGVISGMSADGKSFFYVNPLEVLPEAPEKNQQYKHVKVERQKWFGCACCPPNLARLLASLGGYAYSVRKDTLFMHLYVENSVKADLDAGCLELAVATDYPWDGTVTAKVTAAPASLVKLALRVPGWCHSYRIRYNGEDAAYTVKDSYACLEGLFAPGDIIELVMEMPVTLIEANPRVREDLGKLSVTRGPIVYCLEEADNGKDLHRVFIPANADFQVKYDKDFFGGAVLLESPGKRLDQNDWEPDDLYRKASAPQYEEASLTWVPYYLWANRGPGEMAVWTKALR